MSKVNSIVKARACSVAAFVIFTFLTLNKYFSSMSCH